MYLIPRNVTQKFEFFPGFGWIELFLTLAGLIIGLGLFFIAGIFTRTFARSLLVIFFTAIGFIISKGDPRTGKTVLSLVQDAKTWKTRQRRFLYYFGTGGDK